MVNATSTDADPAVPVFKLTFLVPLVDVLCFASDFVFPSEEYAHINCVSDVPSSSKGCSLSPLAAAFRVNFITVSLELCVQVAPVTAVPPEGLLCDVTQ